MKKIILLHIFLNAFLLASQENKKGKANPQPTFIPANIQILLNKHAQESHYLDYKEEVELLDNFLKENPQNVNATNKRTGESFAMLASQIKSSFIRKLSYSKHVNFTQKDNHGWTVLHHAMLFGTLETVEELLDKKANPYEKAQNGLTPYDIVKNKKHTMIKDRDRKEALVEFFAISNPPK